MGWTKWSSRNCYDFQSGHLYAIGLYGRKIIDPGTHCKDCNIWEQLRLKKLTQKKYCCAKKWEGPSKSMESSAILNIYTRVTLKGYHIGVIVSDNDTTIRAHLKNEKISHLKDKRKVLVCN